MILLLAEYETPTVPLSEICEKYFGIKPSTAEGNAAEKSCPCQHSGLEKARNLPEWFACRILPN
ncbi:pyocin activator PrtN family protein [Citrobacter farmeri]